MPILVMSRWLPALLLGAVLLTRCRHGPPKESGKFRKPDLVEIPRKGSRHNRGCAVDVSLFELATGQEVKMPSGYDEFSERAFPTYSGGTPESRALRDLLRAAMEAEGFTVYPAEWWHFDYQDWRQYRIMD